MRTIIVMTDGEAWSVVDGCCMCVISDTEFFDLCDGHMGVQDLQPIAEIGLKDFTVKDNANGL